MSSLLSRIAKSLSLSKNESNSNNNINNFEESKMNQKTEKKLDLNSIYNNNDNPLPSHLSSERKISESLVRELKFKELFAANIVDVEKLKKLAWDGAPREFRSLTWKILLKYLPTNTETREGTLKRKRDEYAKLRQIYNVSESLEGFNENEKKIIKLISFDVPRTQPDYPLFHIPPIQKMLSRILFIWNSRHPASGYVQGINDITTPLLAVFLTDLLDINYDNFEIPKNLEMAGDGAKLEEGLAVGLDEVEADTYWCLCKILDTILDNYTDAQPGTLKALSKIKEITRKMDGELASHLEANEVDLSQFAFRWVFCLLIREFSLKITVRLFDTYISDEGGFEVLHVYICAAVILKFGAKIKKMSNNEIMTFLQSLPTRFWGEEELKILIAEAYVYKSIFEKSIGHLKI